MTASFVIPIFILSIFPHQEPRFLIPVTLPLIFLHSQRIRHVSSVDAVVTEKRNNDTKSLSSSFKRNKNGTNKILVIWYLINIVLTFFYGFIHQGGVLPLVNHIATELKAKPYLTNVHLFTSHMYSLPTALLQLRNTRKTYVTKEQRKYKLAKDFYIYEQGSENVEQVYRSILTKVEECEKKFKNKKQPYRVYYALPGTFFDEFVNQGLLGNESRLLIYKTVKIFHPHVTVEKLPELQFFDHCGSDFDLGFDKIEICTRNIVKHFSVNFYKLFRQLGLVLLKIESPLTTNPSLDIVKENHQ